MFKNFVEIIKFEKVGRNNFAYFKNGEKISSGDLGTIQIECNKCKSLKELGFRSALLKKEYVCQSCNKIGENNPFYRKTHKTETKQRLSDLMKNRYTGERNPFYGKTHTEKTKSIIREKCVRFGKNNGFYGKKHKKETVERIKQKIKNYRERMTLEQKEKESKILSFAQNKLYEENPEKYIADKRKSAYKSHEVQFQNYKMNKIERIVYEKLVEMGLDKKFDVSVILNHMQFDFGSKEKRMLLEVHGDYWHGNPKLYSEDGKNNTKILNETQKIKQQRDNEKYNFAINNGFKIYYIWESDIINNNWATLKEIENEIRIG